MRSVSKCQLNTNMDRHYRYGEGGRDDMTKSPFLFNRSGSLTRCPVLHGRFMQPMDGPGGGVWCHLQGDVLVWGGYLSGTGRDSRVEHKREEGRAIV